MNKILFKSPLFIPQIELLSQASAGGVEKRSTNTPNKYLNEANADFNEALNLSTAHWAGKLAGIEKISFEYFLTEKHAEQYIGIKDCMIDDFETWLSDLEIDDWIKLGEKFKKHLLTHLTAK